MCGDERVRDEQMCGDERLREEQMCGGHCDHCIGAHRVQPDTTVGIERDEALKLIGRQARGGVAAPA
jgi:hypothetical protein